MKVFPNVRTHGGKRIEWNASVANHLWVRSVQSNQVGHLRVLPLLGSVELAFVLLVAVLHMSQLETFAVALSATQASAAQFAKMVHEDVTRLVRYRPLVMALEGQHDLFPGLSAQLAHYWQSRCIFDLASFHLVVPPFQVFSLLVMVDRQLQQQPPPALSAPVLPTVLLVLVSALLALDVVP